MASIHQEAAGQTVDLAQEASFLAPSMLIVSVSRLIPCFPLFIGE